MTAKKAMKLCDGYLKKRGLSMKRRKPRNPDVFGEWISVEERLPAFNRWVLVKLDDQDQPYTVDLRIDNNFGWSWQYCFKEFVIAWMPLPKPPKKGKNRGKA